MSNKRVKVRRSEAVKKFGKLKTRSKEFVGSTNRKVVVSYSLPVYQVEWIEEQAELRGMHRSTFMASGIESLMAGLEEVEKAESIRDERSIESDDDE